MIPTTAAARLTMIMELLGGDPYLNEDGELVEPPQLITPEEARKLLGINGTEDSPTA